MAGKNTINATDGIDEEASRRINSEIAMKRLTEVPTEPIDSNPDYRRSLRAIAEGRYTTEADMERKRQEILGYDFDEIGEAEAVAGRKEEGLIARVRRALKRAISFS